MTDVVVLGASVAGLSAAARAAQDGADVLLLDPRAGPGDHAPPPAAAFDALWHRPTGLADAELMRYEEVRVRGGGRVARIRAGARLYDRAKLDRSLSEAATEAGASVQWDAGEFIVDPDRRVRWRDGVVRPKILIVADGVEGSARRFPSTLRDPSEVRIAQAWTLEGETDLPPAMELAFTPSLPGGRLQLSPSRSNLILWGFRRDRAPLAAEILDAHPILRGRRPAELVPWGPPRPDPVFALPGNISGAGLLVVGDAAAQADLELGALAGHEAGSVAATAARSKQTTSAFLKAAYEDPWKERWSRGHERFREIYDRFASMPAADQARILEPWERGGLDLRDVDLGGAQRGVARHLSALRSGLRNALRMRALLRTYRQLRP